MEDLQELKEKVDRILWYIENDEKTGRKGLFTECSEMRKDLDGLLQREKIKLAIHATIASIAGAIGTAIVFVIKYLMTSGHGNH